MIVAQVQLSECIRLWYWLAKQHGAYVKQLRVWQSTISKHGDEPEQIIFKDEDQWKLDPECEQCTHVSTLQISVEQAKENMHEEPQPAQQFVGRMYMQ